MRITNAGRLAQRNLLKRLRAWWGVPLLLTAIATALLALAACGGESPTNTPSPTMTPRVTPTPTTVPTSTPIHDDDHEHEPTAIAPVTSGGVTIAINATDDLKFDKSAFSAKSGSSITITLNNLGTTQQHNWVLVENGTKDDVAMAGISSADTGFVAAADARVLANTDLIKPGESTDLAFTAPNVGTYQFVCTFPGHSPTMFGDFQVSP